jgi:hypothetical protein
LLYLRAGTVESRPVSVGAETEKSKVLGPVIRRGVATDFGNVKELRV